MARSTDVRTSFTSGILGAEAHDRNDVEEYYNGARDLLNVDPRPAGGFALRPGTAYYGKLRNTLGAIDLATATITGGPQLAAPPGNGSAPPPPPTDPDPYVELPPWIYTSEGGGVLTP